MLHERPYPLADHGCFFVGGRYREDGTMSGQMYVEYQIPVDVRAPEPLVLIHGGGQTGACFLMTPDGRPGWARQFLKAGFAVYTVDLPGHGRSQGHGSGCGPMRTSHAVGERAVGWAAAHPWPEAESHTQWPGGAHPGDPVFDQFYASQTGSPPDPAQFETEGRAAGIELLERIGPAHILAHSLGGAVGWLVADARPDLVSSLIALEPNGPPVDDLAPVTDPGKAAGEDVRLRPWGLTRTPITYDPPAASAHELSFVLTGDQAASLPRTWVQAEPARQLPNLAKVRILVATGEASYHAPYDHGTSVFLRQAGVSHEFVRLADVGHHGNGHMMMLERNSEELAAFFAEWLRRRPAASDDER